MFGEIAFHSNRSGKISLFSTESTISFIANIYITPKKQILSYRVWMQPLEFWSESAVYRRFNHSAGFRVGQGGYLKIIKKKNICLIVVWTTPRRNPASTILYAIYL